MSDRLQCIRTTESGDAFSIEAGGKFMIKIKTIDSSTFEVTVDSGAVTIHKVTLSEEYYKKLAGAYPPENLIRKSFEFLLEREPNTSILRSFDLKVIRKYFPEYEETIRKM